MWQSQKPLHAALAPHNTLCTFTELDSWTWLQQLETTWVCSFSVVLPPGAGPSTGIHRVLSFKLLLYPVPLIVCAFVHTTLLWYRHEGCLALWVLKAPWVVLA